MSKKWIITGAVVAFALTACSAPNTAPPPETPDIAMCRELSGSWEAMWADETSENHRRIGDVLAASENANLQAAGALYLAAAEYPRNTDGTITLDAAREHLADGLALVKAVAAGCEEIGVELSPEMREAAEAAEQFDGVPTEEEAAATPPVTVAIGDTATIEGEQSGPVTVEVTVATPEQHTADPDGFEPANGVWLVVDVTVAVIAGNYTFSDIYFSFEAADGTAYYASFTAFAPALETDTISAGDEINGKLAFDVPPSVIDGGKILIEGVNFDFSELPGAIWTL